MTITNKSIKILWAEAAGRCAFPGCGIKLSTGGGGNIAPHTIGEMAHIRGNKKGTNRHDASQSQADRDDYENLILLCPTHHEIIDAQENEEQYSVDLLLSMKAEHENSVNGRLDQEELADKFAVAKVLYPLVQENHEVFKHFGPHSDIARKNPNSEAAHSVWLSERLSTIVPNNRRMLTVIEAHTQLFSAQEHSILARFALHVRSYDRWVQDEINYEGVVRFPVEFATLIEELASARE